MDPDVIKDERRGRYELVDEGEVVAVADFHVEGDRVVFPHTEVLPARRGQGLGARLVRAALDDVRGSGASVVPLCWYVAQFISENPAYADLVAS